MRVVVAVVVAFLSIGLGFVLHFEDRFLPSRLVPTPGVGLLGLLPLSLAAVLEMNAASPLSARYPTWWVRVLVVWPLFVAMLAGVIYLSFLGWVAAASNAVADGLQHRLADVQSLGRSESRGHRCRHSMKLKYDVGNATMCADGLPGVDQARAGTKILLVGPSSALGQHVTALRQP